MKILFSMLKCYCSFVFLHVFVFVYIFIHFYICFIITAQAAGDPHITTLDGRDYTFNGVGDFVLVQDLNSTVVIQVRTEQAIDTNGKASCIYSQTYP